jgi:diguanylate cyclase (GGDEF)-like protein/PAS domain S-box-containing protein
MESTMQATSGETRNSISSLNRGPRILIVDDDPLILDSLSRLVEAQGFDVATAAGGQQALAAVGKKHFDLILLDLNMPGMGGDEVLSRLSEQGVATPVIVVSGDNAIDSAVSALRNGAADFIRKPYKPEELLKRIGNTLGKQQLEKENGLIQQRLQQSEKWHRFLVNTSPDFIYTLDSEGRFTFVNDRVESLLGFTREELVGRHYSEVIHEEDLFRAEHVFNERRADARASRNVELRLKCNDGQQRPRIMNGRYRTVEVTATGMYEVPEHRFEHRFMGTYGVVKDISDRKQAEETVHYQTYHDLLTGLPNRAKFRDHLGRALVHGKRRQQALSVMILDLDNFRVINDSLGHGVGDELLIHIAGRLRQCLGDEDILARLGGDEFALLLPDAASRLEATVVGHKLIEALNVPHRIKGHELYITASIGASFAPEDGAVADTLIRQTEIAMYQAKSQGGCRIQHWQPAMQEAFSGRIQMEADLRRALANDEFVLFYQPQVDTNTGAVKGFEALIRWWHPERGLVLPNAFITLAEETGVIVPMGEWVLREAAKQQAQWRKNGLPPVRVSVNISPRQLEIPDFAGSVLRALEANQLETGALELEITESVLMRDVESNAAKLTQLAEAGVLLAIDDFGTGYSSLKYLSRFPIHTLKIDRSFIKDSELDGMSIASAIVGMARNLNLNVIAEGVESIAQLEQLRSLQCSQVQGYLFGMPMSALEATKLLQQQLQGQEEVAKAG